MFKQVFGVLLAALVSHGAWAQAAPTQPVLATASGGPVVPAPAAPNVEAYVRTATTTKGSELDFDKMLATKKQTVFLHNGSMYSKREYALVLWGLRVKALGVASAERACALYAGATNRSLSPAEKQALTDGFESGTPE
ncbi:hypothetical protein [Hymenobacter edaphi]|nr:hypothetical protein [Hymenobacter edaphi]